MMIEHLPFDRLYFYGPDKSVHVSYSSLPPEQTFAMVRSSTGRILPSSPISAELKGKKPGSVLELSVADVSLDAAADGRRTRTTRIAKSVKPKSNRTSTGKSLPEVVNAYVSRPSYAALAWQRRTSNNA